ncbi:MAG TPA: hypothetical protein VEQ11_14035 [Chloroflexota bacterium]|nr:hypothetical protein [Chloroflexota bacterium]
MFNSFGVPPGVKQARYHGSTRREHASGQFIVERADDCVDRSVVYQSLCTKPHSQPECIVPPYLSPARERRAPPANVEVIGLDD